MYNLLKSKVLPEGHRYIEDHPTFDGVALVWDGKEYYCYTYLGTSTKRFSSAREAFNAVWGILYRKNFTKERTM